MNHPGSPFWVPSAALQRHLNRTATGNPDCDWLSHVRTAYLPRRVDRTLVLGCWYGFLERALARHAGIGEILATDTNPAAVEAAEKVARRSGLAAIAYRRLDPESEALPEGPWNLVLANDFLHHVADLEPLLRAIRDVLAPGGHFVFSEYTGPPRFQHGAVTMEIVERYFRVLPDRIRTDPDTGRRIWRHEPVDAARLARELPSEAAASDTLLPLARRLFAWTRSSRAEAAFSTRSFRASRVTSARDRGTTSSCSRFSAPRRSAPRPSASSRRSSPRSSAAAMPEPG